MPPAYDIPRPTGVPTYPTDENPTIRTTPVGSPHDDTADRHDPDHPQGEARRDTPPSGKPAG
jgi:hypothetical protein